MSRLSDKTGAELHIRGTVQGVGFRPFIYNLAKRYDISGTVFNSGNGVCIHATGEKNSLERFIDAIGNNAPPLARILAVDISSLDPKTLRQKDFRILASAESDTADTAIPPDIALCDKCLRELLDRNDRRFLYPFINCTNCGPRFTIIEHLPYDRLQTSMKVFPMCSKCKSEYDDPTNRRFHAQPNACPTCGPQVTLHAADGTPIDTADPVKMACEMLRNGKILAIRGLGGFHLCCDGTSDDVVAVLRKRKNRPDKPLALMVADIPAAEKFAALCEEEKAELCAPSHPIVLLKKQSRHVLSQKLNPGIGDIGIMLPYTPLHHLLFTCESCPEALVMTSGNRGGMPISISNDDALAQLTGIADCFLFHNREILTRVDDSVIKVLGKRPLIVRRARGYCPTPLEIRHSLPQSLACGGGLKSTFCLGRGNIAVISQHIGDLHSLENYDFYLESIAHHKKVFAIEPEICISDLHPDYMSSYYAEETNLPLYRIQHHHAHAVAVMAEHGLSDPVLAVVFDGTGLGTDGTIWGGEILRCELTHFDRLAHLHYLPLPGGEKAVEEPWRMAISALYATFGEKVFEEEIIPSHLQQVPISSRDAVLQMIRRQLNTPLTSSCGRLFDAVAALLGLRLRCTYEGQAAMELEALAAGALSPDWLSLLMNYQGDEGDRFLQRSNGKWEINSCNFVTMIIKNLKENMAPSRIARDFHLQLIATVTTLVCKLGADYDITTVVLSGGSMQNRILLEGVQYVLQENGITVYTGRQVPVNDGGLSFGQLIAGGLQHVSCNSNAGH